MIFEFEKVCYMGYRFEVYSKKVEKCCFQREPAASKMDRQLYKKCISKGKSLKCVHISRTIRVFTLSYALPYVSEQALRHPNVIKIE